MTYHHLPSLSEIRARAHPIRQVAREREKRLSPMDKLALTVTKRVGTMGFFFLIAGWSAFWLSWNLLAPAAWRFDPAPGFVLWLFISNLIQILLMPLLMVGQNVLNLDSELRAQADYEVNLQTESYVEAILQHLEYQNQLIAELLSHVKQEKGGDHR
ncbi:MAG: hypothetical protein CFK49_04150 [Armatimonadetes bacterium JP3_11]|nr:MAG: hypothetical protein CFK49_04150 [Armatimonadetes bacterium JP3_11]